MSNSKNDLVKEFSVQQPKLINNFDQGFLVNAIGKNIKKAIENFGERDYYLNSALQNIDKLKPKNSFCLEIKQENKKSYEKFLKNQPKETDNSENSEGETDNSEEPENETENSDKAEESENEVDKSENSEDSENSEGETDNSEEPDEEIELESVVEFKVDKGIKQKAKENNVALNVGNTVYGDGEKENIKSFVLTKSSIDKNDFVDDSYSPGDLFTLDNPIKLS